MVSYIFERLAKKGSSEGITPDGSMKARRWFRDAAKNINYVNVSDFTRNDKNEKRTQGTLNTDSIGNMYMFSYNAKTQADLPYWDRFPLIFPIELYRDGFLGINLHYLSPVLRAKLMDVLYTTRSNSKYDNTTVLRINYGFLNRVSRFRAFRPCVKRYLFGYVNSKFLYVKPTEWDMALMLPTERFVGTTKGRVFAESNQKIR